jgi:hypothetical protein
MKLSRNTENSPYKCNWAEVNPITIPITDTVWLVDVYDDCQLYINGDSIAWATWDTGEYAGLARAMPEMLYSIADTLDFEAYWLSIDFPDDEDGEEHPRATDWEWSDIYEFITTGKYEEEL